MACRRCSKKLHIRFFFWLINGLVFWDRILTQTNWKATCYWSIQKRHYIWIGKGYNPDYTQNCAGTCTTGDCNNYASPCASAVDCQMLNPDCAMGSCGCPAPLANSSQVADNCSCIASGLQCVTCSGFFLCSVRNYTCSCGSTCGYSCNSGYVWSGVACIWAGPTGVKTMKDTALASTKTINDTEKSNIKTLNG